MIEFPSTHPLNSLQVQIAVVSRAQRRAYEAAVSDLGLNFSQSLILEYLAHLQEAGVAHPNQTEIAERIGLRKPAAGAALEVLSALQLLTRDPAPTDKRAMLVRLTDRGAEVASRINSLYEDVHDKATRGLAEEELSVLRALLSRIQTNLGAMLAGPGMEDLEELVSERPA